MVDVVLGRAREQFRHGYVLDRGVGCLQISSTECDAGVAVGDDAEYAAALHDRQSPAAARPQLLSDSREIVQRATEFDVLHHYVSYFHTANSPSRLANACSGPKGD